MLTIDVITSLKFFSEFTTNAPCGKWQKHVENHAIHQPIVKTDQLLNGLPKNEILWLSTLSTFCWCEGIGQDWV